MKKFEHLFSQDPIGAFEKIEEDYTRYFDVSYKISNEEINKEPVKEQVVEKQAVENNKSIEVADLRPKIIDQKPRVIDEKPKIIDQKQE